MYHLPPRIYLLNRNTEMSHAKYEHNALEKIHIEFVTSTSGLFSLNLTLCVVGVRVRQRYGTDPTISFFPTHNSDKAIGYMLVFTVTVIVGNLLKQVSRC